MTMHTSPVATTGSVPDADARADVYARPAARVDADGKLEVRASAVGACRRALWYAATGYQPTNPPTDAALTVMETGNALEPVVLRAMARAGWTVTPADPSDPQPASIRIDPHLVVTGHPDATGRRPRSQDATGPATGTPASMFLFEDDPPALGDEMIVEVKTRGPEAFKRWRTLGAERSHPTAVAQAAVYTLGTFGRVRDAVIATMDTASRSWDYEVIPARRVAQALERACAWLNPLGAHYAVHGTDPDALPARDFAAGSWQCRSCPFLARCLPGAEAEATADAVPEVDDAAVSAADAQAAVAAYAAARDALKDPERDKRAALDTLKAWMRRQGAAKTTIAGHTVSLVQAKRYAVDHRKLNALLDPATRAEIVTERASEFVRVN